MPSKAGVIAVEEEMGGAVRLLRRRVDMTSSGRMQTRSLARIQWRSRTHDWKGRGLLGHSHRCVRVLELVHPHIYLAWPLDCRIPVPSLWLTKLFSRSQTSNFCSFTL